MKGKNEEEGAELKIAETTPAAPNNQKTYDINSVSLSTEPGGPKRSNKLDSLMAVLREVEGAKYDWPRKSFQAIISRWNQMPKGGWNKVLEFYCAKFKEKISIVRIKKMAQKAHENEAGTLTRVREFKEENTTKRRKTLDEIARVCTIKDVERQNEIDKRFKEMWTKIKDADVCSVQKTRKISSLKANYEIIESLNLVAGNFLLKNKVNNMNDIITCKGIKKSVWKESIEDKINAMEQKKTLFDKCKFEKDKITEEEKKALRKCMRERNLILSKANDVIKMELYLKERILVYKKKIEVYEKRKAYRNENTKFELYRGRYYRDLNAEEKNNHKVGKKEIEDFWSKMWENAKQETLENEEEYLWKYKIEQPSINAFPTEEEFKNIIGWLPNWKAAGPDRVYNFFIKKMSCLHGSLYKVIKKICPESYTEEEWFYRGITYLIPKGQPVEGKDFRPITCMSNLYKLTTKCITYVLQELRKVRGAKEQAMTNNMLNREFNYKIKTAWINVKKAYDSTIEILPSKWNLEIFEGNEKIMEKKARRGILQGDSLSPLLFVLCIDPLSRKLNSIYPKLSIPLGEQAFVTNHLLFIDDLKILAENEEVLKEMIDETRKFFNTVGLEINAEKSATNSIRCKDEGKLLEGHEGYKYLGITESHEGKIMKETKEKILKAILLRIEKLCKTKLNAKHLFKAINEHGISPIKYYIGIIDAEPEEYKIIDDNIGKLLIKYHVHQQPATKERLYLSRAELGLGLQCVEHKKTGYTYLSIIEGYIKEKYKLKENVTAKILIEAQTESLYSDIKIKTNHSKLFRPRDDPLIDIKQAATWLTKGNMSPRENRNLFALQDRNIFLEKRIKCPHCHEYAKTVDHMATQCDRMLSHYYMRRHNEALRCIHLQLCRTYGLSHAKRIRNHSVQECIANEYVEIRADT
ncbi:reverse transcriptase [Vairimorpha necatrix]|uniref:Reverse transcriptase n=1 Tax=Vairimorpha necatrix TaxID=6039 RepID=A0AAX4J9M6_9MICR